MTEPSKENARLAERLLTIGQLLRDGATPARTNGHDEPMETYPPNVALTGADLTLILEAIGRSVSTELGALAQRLAALEAMRESMLTDGGIWNAATVYEKGAVVTYQGAPWIANEPNSNAKPGTSDVWRLMGKSHR
jgi:hypothetical protein